MASDNFLFDLNHEPIRDEDELHLRDLNSELYLEEDNGSIGVQSEDELHQETLSNTGENSSKKRKIITDLERRAIYDMLLQKSVDGKLKKRTTMTVASAFSILIRTVQRIWKQAKDSSTGDITSRKASNCGRKRIHINFNQMREIPLHQRTTLESLACSLKVSKTKTFSLLKAGDIRRHSNSIKPYLKEENKISRLRFCVSMLEESSLPHDPKFKGMYNMIHIDEKWFIMSKQSENYYLVPDEDEPIRTCKSKNFIGKVMFLAVIARPRFDAQGNEDFSGKIGIFPFVKQEPAKRSSVNRVAGTLETKPITSVTRDIVRSFMIEKVLPAIREKWPRNDTRDPIFIQQDNAKTHIHHNDIEFCEAAKQDGFDIRLMCQPPNSLDLNILDLGFFSAIQALQCKERAKTVDELVNNVVKSFEDFSAIRSNHIFLTLQLCMIEIMKARGSHKYKIPHIGKVRLQREGILPVQLKCDATLVQDVQTFLN